MAQRGAQPRRQFAHAEGFFDIVVRAEVERLDLLGFAIAGGENDHRRLRKRPDVAQHVLAVTVGQAEVQNDEVRRAGDGHAQGLGARLRRDHVVARRRQGDMQQALNLRLVVDDEDPIASDRTHGAGFKATAAGSAAGRRMTIRVPLRRTAGLCAAIEPPMA